MALERLKQDYDFDYESVGISEVDEFANLSYEAIHDNKGNVEDVSDDEKRAFLDSLNIPINTDKMEKKNLKGKRLSAMYKAAKNTNNYGDISKINPDNLPDIDLFTYSFPCTDISSIGEQKGFSKGSGTRSSLLWDCEKIIDIKRPKFLLMENVKALVGKKNINGFNEWIEVLEKLGYNNYWQVLNAIDYGIPQNRERVFLVSILKEYDKGFKFPESFKLDKDIRDLLVEEPDEKLYYPDFSIDSYMNYNGSFPRRSRFLTQSRMTNLNHISPTLTASGGNKCTSAAIYEPKGDNLTWSINNLEEKETRDKTTVDDIVDNYKVRRLAPIENFRLMGVSDDDFYKAEKVCSKTQLNKQAGNAIVVDVLYYIFKSLFNLQDD